MDTILFNELELRDFFIKLESGDPNPDSAEGDFDWETDHILHRKISDKMAYRVTDGRAIPVKATQNVLFIDLDSTYISNTISKHGPTSFWF